MTYYNAEKIVDQNIHGGDLRVYTLGFESGKPRVTDFVSLLIEVIPEFAFGVPDSSIDQTKLVGRIKEAARSIYPVTSPVPEKIAGNLTRGELGELILHLFLRDFFNSIPLISSIYFKDSDGVAVHGFDAVHVVVDGDNKSLWLGESKFYQDGKSGIRNIAQSIKEHFESSYLRRQFALISKKVAGQFPDKEYWLELIHGKTSLDQIFSKVVVPCLCVYDCTTYASHQEASDAFKKEILKECESLKTLFDTQKQSITPADLDLLLLLFPVPSKKELGEDFNKKLFYFQSL